MAHDATAARALPTEPAEPARDQAQAAAVAAAAPGQALPTEPPPPMAQPDAMAANVAVNAGSTEEGMPATPTEPVRRSAPPQQPDQQPDQQPQQPAHQPAHQQPAEPAADQPAKKPPPKKRGRKSTAQKAQVVGGSKDIGAMLGGQRREPVGEEDRITNYFNEHRGEFINLDMVDYKEVGTVSIQSIVRLPALHISCGSPLRARLHQF